MTTIPVVAQAGVSEADLEVLNFTDVAGSRYPKSLAGSIGL